MKHVVLLSTLALSLLIAAPAQAAIGCQGIVNQVVMTPEGDISADWGFGGMKICISGASVSIYRNANSTSPASISATHCQALYSAFLSAMESGKPVLAYVDSSTCTVTTTTPDGMPNPYPYIFYFLKQ